MTPVIYWAHAVSGTLPRLSLDPQNNPWVDTVIIILILYMEMTNQGSQWL